MSSRPLVALTTTFVAEGGSHRRPQVTLYSAYLTVLEEHGLAPVMITPFHARPSIDVLLEQCAGLVLTGGEDVEPKRYGETPHPALGTVTPERDEMEMMALDIAVNRHIPVLAICRGVQLMNVFFGGTLYQDIASQLPSAVLHEQKQPWSERTHAVHLKPGSRLRAIVETDTLQINSFHHQAIKEVGAGLVVTGVAEDGVVESVEAIDHPWAVGVQWHPERHEASAGDGDPDRRLFAAFAAIVTTYADQSK
jgi:putative glutamine amidotransferase